MSYIKLESEYEDLDKYNMFKRGIFYCKKNTGIWHNPYGPAFISKENNAYWIEGKLHRLDGPAIVYLNGIGFYFINNQKLSKEEFEVHPERLKYLGKEHLICIT